MKRLGSQSDSPLTRYEILVPLDGTVIEKHVVLGEVVKDDAEIFVIADLSSVWVDLSVYQKDLSSVRKGQDVVISMGRGTVQANGRIAYIGPVIGESTRTALARIVLANPEGQWRPGLFVTAHITVNEFDVPLLVPKTALQIIDDETHVFVQSVNGFEPVEVTVGRSDALNVEIIEGLQNGQLVVTQGAFTLKAELGKGSLGDGHNH